MTEERISPSQALSPIVEPAELDPTLDRDLIRNLRDADANEESALSANTLRSYATGWRQYREWCRSRFLQPLTAHPEQIATYLASLVPSDDPPARKKISTIKLRLAALKHFFREEGQVMDWQQPVIVKQLRGLARRNPTLVRQEAVQALGLDDLEAIVAEIDPGELRGLRDRALILLGFAGAFRRSELVAVEVGHLRPVDGGYEIWLGTTKTDEGDRDNIAVIAETGTALCPVRALNDWLERANLIEGPVFRGFDPHGRLRPTALTDQSVRLVLKNRAEAAGLNVKRTKRGGKVIIEPQRWGGHSFRRGMATAVSEATGGDVTAVQRAGRWKSAVTALRYVEETQSVEKSASALVMGKKR
jgi:integrase